MNLYFLDFGVLFGLRPSAISLPCFVPTWIDHMKRDAISDVWKAVPEILDEDKGDGELHVRDEEGHRDGSCPPKSPQHDLTFAIICFENRRNVCGVFPVCHLDNPMHPVHTSVGPDANQL